MLTIYTGSYVGDGLDGRVIPTGISGTIKQLTILPLAPGGGACKTPEMPLPAFVGQAGGVVAGGLSFGPDADFTVTFSMGGNAVNGNLITYCWSALAE